MVASFTPIIIVLLVNSANVKIPLPSEVQQRINSWK